MSSWINYGSELTFILFHRKKYAEYHKSEFAHLADLGLVEFTKHGVRLLNNGTILLFNKNDVHIVDDFMHSESRLVKVDNVDEVEVGESGGDNGTKNNTNGTKLGTNGTNGTKNEDMIIELLLKEPKMTYDRISKSLEIPRRTVARDMKALQLKNKIKRIGTNRSGYWEVV
jgi:predicted HTH transcriptional regulator